MSRMHASRRNELSNTKNKKQNHNETATISWISHYFFHNFQILEFFRKSKNSVEECVRERERVEIFNPKKNGNSSSRKDKHVGGGEEEWGGIGTFFFFQIFETKRHHVFLNRFFSKQNNLYFEMKELEQSLLEFVRIQENYLKDEMKNLKREMIRAKEEVKRIKSVPLVIGQFLEMVDENYGIVSSTSWSILCQCSQYDWQRVVETEC